MLLLIFSQHLLSIHIVHLFLTWELRLASSYVSGMCQGKISSGKIPVVSSREDRWVCTLTRNFSAIELSKKMKSNYLSLNEKHLFQDHKTSKNLVYWFSFLEKITSINWFSVILNSTIPNLVIHLERGDSNIFFLFLFAIIYVYRSNYSFGYRFPYSSEFIFKKGISELIYQILNKISGDHKPTYPM